MTAYGELQEQRRPAPARRRRYLALAGAAAAVAAVAAGVAVFQTDAKPAYALSPNGDGSVTFTHEAAAGMHAAIVRASKPR